MLRPVVLLVLCATARRVFSWLIRSLLAVVDGREDLMDRGVLEAAELKMAFVRLEDEKGGSITTVQDLLKWNIIGSAIKEGVVSLTSQFRFPWRSDRRLRHTATELGKSLRDGAVEEIARRQDGRVLSVGHCGRPPLL